MQLLPVSAIIPTLDRRGRLARTMGSLFSQSAVPTEVIIVDASGGGCVGPGDLPLPPTGMRLVCQPAIRRGAAHQRNQAVASATEPYLLFIDDDVDFEPRCIETLWATMQADARCGGCGVVITNQAYHPPGRSLRLIYRWLGCPAEGSLAGHCTGPALNFLPALDPSQMHPDGTVDWLNLGCTLYRRSALPTPLLLPFFQGYSLMEDAALALEVGKRWRLAVPSTARAFHDSQPADYKSRIFAREKMETVNRWFVMRRVMDRDTLGWDLRQFAYQLLGLLLLLRRPAGWQRLPAALAGKVAGLASVLLHGHRWRGYISGTRT